MISEMDRVLTRPLRAPCVNPLVTYLVSTGSKSTPIPSHAELAKPPIPSPPSLWAGWCAHRQYCKLLSCHRQWCVSSTVSPLIGRLTLFPL